ncbi:MAG: tetratricopeptide repeat protein [bacterium]|nr:tetratricopeptide repeat protein [bacterium]
MIYVIGAVVVIFVIAIFVVMSSLKSSGKIKKAEEFMKAGEFSKASEIVKKLLEERKDNAAARYLKARILMEQKQFLLAISELNSVLNISGFTAHVKEVDIHYLLAELYKEVGKPQKEIDEYEKILQFKPKDATANHRMGHTLYRQKDYKKTMEHLTKAIVVDPSLNDSYLPLGVSCFMEKNFEDAEKHLEKAMSNPGESSEAEYYLGYIYKSKKEHDRAIPLLENSKKNSQFAAKSLFLLGEIFFERNEFAKVIEYLEKEEGSLKNSSEEAPAYRYLLGECYEMESKIVEAVAQWEKVSAANPSFRDTAQKLDSYKVVMENSAIMGIFTASADDLQKIIVKLIGCLNFNVISRQRITPNLHMFKATNLKKAKEPPTLILFNRSTKEITDGQINDLHSKVKKEDCGRGIYITTAKFDSKAKNVANSKSIEIYDSEFVSKKASP